MLSNAMHHGRMQQIDLLSANPVTALEIENDWVDVPFYLGFSDRFGPMFVRSSHIMLVLWASFLQRFFRLREVLVFTGGEG